jgi:uncharacterized protein YukE
LGADLDNRRVLTMPPGRSAGILTVTSSGNATIASFDSLAEGIRSTKLITDIVKRIDDPTRFDDLHRRTRDALLAELAPITGRVSASIRTIQETFASAQESFAQTVTELQASVATAAAGVRQVSAASASANRAVATSVTQVTARLDNFSGGAPGTATVETKMTAIADRATGLEAQYVLKVSAGGYTAGIGLASTAGGVGGAAPSSAFIVQADKFAIVDSSYVGGLTNSPPASALLFGVDGDGAYVGGNLKVSGKAQIDGVTSDGVTTWALLANTSGNAVNGVQGSSGTTAGAGIVGRAVHSGARGVRGYAVSPGSTGGYFTASHSTSTALRAGNTDAAGAALNIESGLLVWNSYSYALPDGTAYKVPDAAGNWQPMAKAIKYISTSATAGASLGYMTIDTLDGTGQVKVEIFATV